MDSVSPQAEPRVSSHRSCRSMRPALGAPGNPPGAVIFKRCAAARWCAAGSVIRLRRKRLELAAASVEEPRPTEPPPHGRTGTLRGHSSTAGHDASEVSAFSRDNWQRGQADKGGQTALQASPMRPQHHLGNGRWVSLGWAGVTQGGEPTLREQPYPPQALCSSPCFTVS